MIHVPAGLLFKVGSGAVNAAKKFCDAVRRLMFLPTWNAAHAAWLRSNALGSEWETLGEGIEVATALARVPEGPTISRIALRSVKRKYDAAVVVVEAVLGSVFDESKPSMIYDETRIVSGLDRHWRTIILAGFPAYETYVSSRGFLTSTYSEYRVRITSLTEGGVTRSVHLEENWWKPLDRTIAQPYLWKYVGKDLFNIGEIVWAKDEYAAALNERFGDNVLVAMLFSRPVVTAIFWTPFVLRLKKFQPKVFDEQAARLKTMREAEQLEISSRANYRPD